MATQMHGVLAYLDLLGFTERVSKRKINADVLEKYMYEVFDAAKTLDRRGERDEKQPSFYVGYAVFSDSLVFHDGHHVSDPDRCHCSWAVDRGKHLKRIIMACSYLSWRLLEMGQPFRGCITEGQYYFHTDRRGNGILVVGEPVLKAVEWERNQDWIGIMLDPDLVKADPGLRSCCDRVPTQYNGALWAEFRWPLMLGRCENIPICEMKRYSLDGYAVVPTKKDDKTVSQAIGTVQEACEALKGLRAAAQPKVWHKYDATLAWYEKMIEFRKAARAPCEREEQGRE